jgi:hypothetical protein
MDMVRTKPESVRLVAFSLRGYEDSSRFDESGMLPYHTIGRILGEDFISIVEYVVNVLGVPHNKGSSLSIMAWSLAAASVVAGYGALVSTSAATDRKWATYISKIVFYEPAGGRALGLNPWRNHEQKRQLATTQASTSQASTSQASVSQVSPTRNEIATFVKTISSYYPYPEEVFLSNPSLDELDDPKDDFEVQDIFEHEPYPIYAGLLYREPKNSAKPEKDPMELVRADTSAFVQDALTAMVNTEISKIQVVSTKYTLPGCMLAARWLNSFLGEAAPDKFRLTWIPGRYNHFVHNTAPECLWKALGVEEQRKRRSIFCGLF